MTTFRLLFLGAGFSVPAGLPLGAALFRHVRRVINGDQGTDNHVERDIARFIEYLERCFGRNVLPDEIDCEEFLGFLDVEHYLGLKGKDTFSAEGNESQLMIRRAIGKVIHSMTPRGDAIPDVYRRFAGQLNSSDYICTFNYDTLLEQALELEGVPYRLYPQRYSDVGPTSCIIDTDTPDELAVIKLHGSIDWYSRQGFDVLNQQAIDAPELYPIGHQTKHPIFGYDASIPSRQLTDGPRPADDSLQLLYRVDDVERAHAQPWWNCSPFILSPSTAKLYNAQPLMEFWRGLQRGGGTNLSLGIIGYSCLLYTSPSPRDS